MKKILSVVLIFCIAIISAPCVIAANDDNTITCGEVTATAGGTVCVPIKIENNTGIMGFSIKITYNKDVFTPLSTVAGAVLSSGALNDNIENASPGSFRVVWTHSENVNTDGTLFTITFNISASASGNENISLSYNQADTFNDEWQDVVFHCVNGNVSIDNPVTPESNNIVTSVDPIIMAGDSFDLPVTFDNVTEFMGFSIIINYDSTVFTPVSILRGDAFVAGAMNNNIETASGTLKVIWTGTENTTSNGTAFTVRFESNRTASASQYVIGITYVQEDTFNESWQEVLLNCEDSTVTIKGYKENNIFSQVNAAQAATNVTVPLLIKNNTGFMGFSIKLSYDKDILTPVSVASGDVLSSGSLNDSIGVSPSGSLKVVYTSSENVTADGTLFSVTFTVNEAAFGSITIDLSYIQADTFNEDWEDVVLNCEPISLTVENPNVAPSFGASAMTVQAGSEFPLPVSVTNNCALTAFSICLAFDGALLTPVSVSSGSAISGSVTSNIETATSGTLNISWSGSAVAQDGGVFSVTFAVREYASDTSDININCNTTGTSFEGGGTATGSTVSVNIINPQEFEPAQVYGEAAVTCPGGTVEVPLYISKNKGMMGFAVNVSYDSDILTPVSVSRGTVTASGNLDDSIESTHDGSFRIVWNDIGNVTASGHLLTITFMVSAQTTADGAHVSYTYSQADTYNEDWQDVELILDSTEIYINRLTITAITNSVKKGATIQLTAGYTLDEATPENVMWTSGNTSVATVDTNGVVRGVGRGNVVITATTADGLYTATKLIRVLPVEATIVINSYSGGYSQKVEWWKSYSTAKMNLGYQAYNCDGAVRYEWSSSNKKVNIDQNGNITNIGSFARSATITLTEFDADGNVVAKNSVKVSFYKFSWQKSKLQSQSVLSDNWFGQKLTVQELEKIESERTDNPTLDRVCSVLDWLSNVFFLL